MKSTVTLIAAGAALAALPALAHAQSRPDFTGAWRVAAYSPALKPEGGGGVPLKPEESTTSLSPSHLATW